MAPAQVLSSPSVITASSVAAAPSAASLNRTAEDFLSPVKDENKKNLGVGSKSSVKPKAEEKRVRPFTRTPRVQAVKPVDTLSSLLQEIVAGQERHVFKASHYDQAINIFQERFRFGLNSKQEMAMITLFAESSSVVKQFLAFSEDQRISAEFLFSRKLPPCKHIFDASIQCLTTHHFTCSHLVSSAVKNNRMQFQF